MNKLESQSNPFEWLNLQFRPAISIHFFASLPESFFFIFVRIFQYVSISIYFPTIFFSILAPHKPHAGQHLSGTSCHSAPVNVIPLELLKWTCDTSASWNSDENWLCLRQRRRVGALFTQTSSWQTTLTCVFLPLLPFLMLQQPDAHVTFMTRVWCSTIGSEFVVFFLSWSPSEMGQRSSLRDGISVQGKCRKSS